MVILYTYRQPNTIVVQWEHSSLFDVIFMILNEKRDANVSADWLYGNEIISVSGTLVGK
jgi:hypothetical protein